ncbi:copper homeostasis periplasmic binding protein CopC [Rhizobium mayense]|uniref:Copper homeostasis periplasmic binding protein CopC n=1 Tax=Rhizobium mayense TaxID=1312184 RepID=A0ABT7JNZ1_9HYPH|nr:copper homeostasis periplasmic binding protein CopC [Rhizobium mayense]MDL2398047.1 copper homeostasis periplasmic binding protein CopC [Rhizobium mayense]
MPRTKKLVLIAAAASLVFAGQAFAHAQLKSAVPAADSTVKQAPSELDLTFTEGLNLKFSGVKVTGPGKAAVKTGEGMLMNGDSTLMVPITDKLTAGKYTVEWHALSADGHKTNGTYSFTVAP